MATIKNGTSIYDLKDFMINTIAPKYFDNVKSLSELNVGLFGYITDILGSSVNDSFFTITSLFKEIFPNQAELPESIYNHAILYQLSNIFANPASMKFAILISEASIIERSTTGTDYLYFDMDQNMTFNINGLTYMLDYDIRIYSSKTINGYTHRAQYIMDHTNSISGLNNPYIRCQIYNGSNGKPYIYIEVLLHQVVLLN